MDTGYPQGNTNIYAFIHTCGYFIFASLPTGMIWENLEEKSHGHKKNLCNLSHMQ